MITEAKRLCPDVIIVLGEDISRFRDASKELYTFLKSFSWNDKVERLGFDEVWLDVTDLVEYNLDTLNLNNLPNSFFQTSKDDPTQGFSFDASEYAGHVFPSASGKDVLPSKDLSMRLCLGSHLAMHARHQLENEKGYTSTVGISTNKLLSKLVGSLNKPKGQTTLVPPYDVIDGDDSNAISFIDAHDIGKVPGIGFKMAQKLREGVLQRPAGFDTGLVYGGTKENVTVRDVRLHPGMDTERLEKLLSGPGAPHGIGSKVWSLLHGVDDTEVGFARPVPRQISIEDSYIRLDTMSDLLRELNMLSRSLLTRMRIDLLIDDEDAPGTNDGETPLTDLRNKKWLAHPKSIRLSTRPKPPLNADGVRQRSFKRISHSGPLPQFVFSLTDGIEPLAEKLVNETVLPMFHRLHPEKHGWNLSLVNIAVTNMAETAGDSKTATGRNIGSMFKRQEDVLKDFRVIDEPLIEDSESPEDKLVTRSSVENTSLRHNAFEQDEDVDVDVDDTATESSASCSVCGLRLPSFALAAHERYHALGD